MKKLLFVSLAAALTLASCSSDDKQNAPVNPGVTEGYIAFNLSGVANLGGRADISYEDGTTGNVNESKVDKISLYFFDIYGRQTRGVEELTEAKWTKVDAGGTNSIEDKYQTVAIELTKDPDNANGTVEVLAVVNQAGSFDKDKTKADIVAHLSHNKTYAQDDLKGADPFSMSSSVYRDGKIVYDCTPISLNNVFTTKEAAEAAPVDIYVEREMAKVDVPAFTANVTFDGNDGQVYNDLNPTAGEAIKVKILGIGVTYVPTTSHLFKQHTGAWISKDNLVSATNHRSFWADPVYTGKTANYLTVDKYPYNADNEVVADAAKEYLNLSWNGKTDLSATGDAHVYVTENTTGAFSHIMLLGQILDGSDQPVSLVRWAGKNYKADTFKTQYVNMLKYAGYFKKTGPETYVTLDAADLEWYEGAAHQALVEAVTDPIKAYENTCYVKDGIEVVKKNAQGGVAPSTKADVDAELLKPNYRVWYYKSGMNYYYLPIKSGFTAAEDVAVAAENGIVRNHVYQVKVKTITGLGTPVADPAEVIIPENPADKAFYMAATINVLQWRVVAGDYNFTTN